MTKKLISLFSKAVFIATAVVLCAFLLFNLSTIISVQSIKSGGSAPSGYAIAIVNSGSMEPEISKNYLLIIKSRSSYKEGDIVTYVSNNGTLITHRIMQITENGYITQGDANNTLDSEIAKRSLLGKVIFMIPRVGFFVKIFSSPITVAFVVLFPVCIVFISRLMRNIKEE